MLLGIFLTSAILAGLVIHANVVNCDPKSEGLIKNENEVATHFVMRNLVDIYGLSGVFLASLLSGALR